MSADPLRVFAGPLYRRAAVESARSGPYPSVERAIVKPRHGYKILHDAIVKL